MTDFEKLKRFIFNTIEDFTKELVIDDEDRNWILVRLGYLLGEYFNEKYNGFWNVNENIESSQYGKYVLLLEGESKRDYSIDIFEELLEFINTKPYRSLIKLITEIEKIIK